MGVESGRVQQIGYSDLVSALQQVGLKTGDMVFVHSRLFSVGLLAGVTNPSQIPQVYLQAFQEVLGETGTLVVPTYTTSFGRYGKPFVFEQSSSEMGLFSETVRKSPGARRSLHPIYSVAALGAQAAQLTDHHPPWNVGFDTVWDRMLQRGTQMLALGLPLRQCMSFIHHVEYLACVPYLYHKLLEGQVLAGGKPLTERFVMVVRYLEFDVGWDLAKLESDLQSAGFMERVALGSTSISSVGMRDVFQVCMQGLKRDPYYLLKQPPRFVQGRIPWDGPSILQESGPPQGYYDITE